MCIAHPATVEALQRAKNRHHSLDAVMDVYGIQGTSKGALSRMLRGEPVSVKAERAVREALGVKLPPYPTIRLAPDLAAQFDALRQPHESRSACLRRLISERG